MGLKEKWCNNHTMSNCNNCIHSFEKYHIVGVDNKKVTKFHCKVGIKIPNNHWTKQNDYSCINHRWNNSFKIKKRISKNKCKMIVKKQLIKKTIIKEYV